MSPRLEFGLQLKHAAIFTGTGGTKMTFKLVAFAGRPQQPPTRTAADVITVLGCVQREADYRAEIQQSKGGIAGTGIGAGHQFVLRRVEHSSNDTLKPRGTSGRFEDVYTITDKLEGEMDRGVGHEVAVSGYVEVAATDGTKKVEDLPRLNVVGWNITSQTCRPVNRAK